MQGGKGGVAGGGAGRMCLLPRVITGFLMGRGAVCDTVSVCVKAPDGKHPHVSNGGSPAPATCVRWGRHGGGSVGSPVWMYGASDIALRGAEVRVEGGGAEVRVEDRGAEARRVGARRRGWRVEARRSGWRVVARR